jgi:cysteine desulfurase/selenocysteine lyase
MNGVSPTRHYLDNAATTFPKPPGVVAAVCEYMEHNGASAGRGAYRAALESRQIIDDCRAAIARLFGAGPDCHVCFTLNGTDGLNMAIKGLVRPGDHVVTTAMDHNSVLRPLGALEERGDVTHTVVPADPDTTRVTVDAIAAALRPHTRLVALNHASNVTGVLQPYEDVAELCRARGIPLLLDAAQSAGHLPIDLGRVPVDVLACPGHKGLLGPLGTGVLIVRDSVAERMETLREGGTGSESERPVQPRQMPDRFEPGSHNAPGIAGLRVAVEWLLARGLSAVRAHELELCARLADGLDAAGVRWFGPRVPTERVGVFSVRVDGFDPGELATLLELHHGVLSRAGLHCAPLAHRTIGTDTDGGTTRLSCSALTTETDVDAAVAALAELRAAAGAAARAG